MRPLKLTMSAFGSYADVQTIDFTRLGASGLYLITGETGSGKTTIFDAVSFALFGKASGAARDDYYMLRSDFATEAAKTYVDLDFISAENRYNIRRSVKRTGQDVVLTLPDGTTMSGDRNIRQKIAEIVGLDRDQFAQIVMIAQNDFLRFLQSGTDERLKILRRIFDTESLKQFQERLKTRAKRESDKRAMIIHDFERCEVDVYRRDEQFDEWDRQTEAYKEELAKADERLAIYDQEKQRLAAALATAEELCKRFADLAASRAAQKEHAAGAEEIKGLGQLAARGEIALRRVKPLADEARKAAANHKSAATDLTGAKELEAAARAESEQATEALGELPPLGEAQSALAGLSKEWEASAERLKVLKRLRGEFAVIRGKMDELSAAQSDFKTLHADFLAADNAYKALEEAFLRNQAGILASGLTDGAPCPVCGSKDHPAPAALPEGDISEAKRKAAKEKRDGASAKRESKAADCASRKTETETLGKRFLDDLSEHIPDVTLETSEAELTGLFARAQGEADALSAKRKADEAAVAKLAGDWERATKRKNDADSALKSAGTLITEREANERKQLKFKEDAEAAYGEALRVHDFADEAAYASALITEAELATFTKRLTDYEKFGDGLGRDILRLESETAGKEMPDLASLKAESEEANAESANLSERRDKIKAQLGVIESALKELRLAAAEFEKVEKTYAAVKQLADTANGRLDFETYAQTAYFERVLRAANRRLKLMSLNRYTLLRKVGSDDGRRRSGLEIEVLDAYTGKARSANSLSGGESFMASLSLALGLSDVVQQSAGGVRLDAMFIDEGFGSLDADVLELAIGTLSEMAGADRIIGIISHVAELRERIDKQIRVEKTTAGSRISLMG